MGLHDRPYVGTWRLGQQKLVQSTPDALVYINGDVSLPGCNKCSGKIDFQKFITEVSVDAGTDASGASANLSLSIPLHHNESFARDAQFIFRPGLEVHVYMRGYFPVKGLYRNLAEPASSEFNARKSKTAESGTSLRTGENPDSFLDQQGLTDSGLEDVVAYPYYHVFHGVVTQVDHSWSGGMSNITMNCGSMLHFWSYHKMSSQASLFGARPVNSNLHVSHYGHNFTGMHPYAIMYNLHHSTVGAAGAVGWAISQKTNVASKSEVNRESLFSLNIRYWEQRFGKDTIKLRLYGASGELFNSVQAAYLATSSSSELTSDIRNRFIRATESKNTTDVMSRANKTGLKAEALVVADKSKPSTSNNTGLDINIIEMKAFVEDLGQIANYNFFESAYESKLDIAQRVCEVTGFEFFQDVDGDFVFKPPLYNLDTSSSRIYRIEDIDIISISFSEKEPEATYAVGKNTLFNNMETGINNEWGHQGTYIDYRLVAQFGWRPLNFETTYLNDPKSLFFAAVNRMTLMNAAINSASISIPLRPELRPGYPIYVKTLDCFFYCNSFSHSFSVGGQCTTSLQLTAKRAKFYAPGDATQSGIEAIDLANTILPRKPLEVFDPSGQPRLTGFPNVVMALDPNQLNPLFFVVGLDIEDLEDAKTIENLLAIGAQIGLIRPDPNGRPGVRCMTVPVGYAEDGVTPKSDTVYFFMSTAGANDIAAGNTKKTENKKGAIGAGVGSAENPFDILEAARAYQNIAKGLNTSAKLRSDRSAALAQKTAEANQKLNALKDTSKKPKTKKAADLPADATQAQKDAAAAAVKAEEQAQAENEAKNKETEDTIRKELTEAQEELNKIGSQDRLASDFTQLQLGEYYTDPDNASQAGVNLIAKVIGQLRKEWLKKHPEYTDLDSTTTLLDLLADKKATFSNGQQPGYYRYYSASHPLPEHQGQNEIKQVQTADGKKEIQQTSSTLDNAWGPVDTFLPSREIRPPWPGASLPEAQFGPKKPVRGMRVLTGNSKYPQGELIPTSEIYAMMFSVQQSEITQKKQSTVKIAVAADFGAVARAYLHQKFNLSNAGTSGDTTVLRVNTFATIFGPTAGATTKSTKATAWDRLASDVTQAFDQATQSLIQKEAKRKGRDNAPPKPIAFAFPTVIQINGTSINTATQIGTLLEQNQAKFSNMSVPEFINKGGEQLAESFYSQINTMRRDWLENLYIYLFKKDDIEASYQMVNEVINSAWGLKTDSKTQKETIHTRKKKDFFYSPVFPVSDARGYEVIGSYRYGRGLSIDQDNVLNSLHYQDPLRFLSRETVEEFLAAITGTGAGKEMQIPVIASTTTDIDGRVNIKYKTDNGNPVMVTVPRKDPKYKQHLQLKMVQELQDAGLSNSDIVELFKLKNSDPTMIDIGFMNWYAEKGKEGVFKLPVANNAYSLADLDTQSNKGVCDCKAAEAEVLLEGYKDQEYVQFSVPGDVIPLDGGQYTTDRATHWAMQTAAIASASWSQSQAALRGEILDTGGSAILQSAEGLDEALKQANRDNQAREQALQDQSEKALQRLENLKKKK